MTPRAVHFLAVLALILGTTGCRVAVERRTSRIAKAVVARDTAQYLAPFGPTTRPFTPAVRLGNLIFLSGQLGTEGDRLVAGGIEGETRQAMENIRTLLGAVGSSMDRVVKCTVMMADMTEWDRMNAVYRTFFKPGRLPARSALGANGLALGGRVEIECVASA